MNPSTDKLLLFEKVLILKSLSLFTETTWELPLAKEMEYGQELLL
jgi:hypothetical protein